MEIYFFPIRNGAILYVIQMFVGAISSSETKQCPRESGLHSFSHLWFNLLKHLYSVILLCGLSFCLHLSVI